MPACSMIKTITTKCIGRSDPLLHSAEPQGNSFDYTTCTNSHEITVYYFAQSIQNMALETNKQQK